MKFRIFFLATMVLIWSAVSCKRNTDKINKNEEPIKVTAEQGPINLLKYKVKEEIFKKDSLGLDFKGIYLDEIAEEEYNLRVEVDAGPEALGYHDNYYVILSLYPLDDELQLLKKERRKYGFEMFSAKIRKNKFAELQIGRIIKTKINFARAITLTIIEIRSKEKTKEVVLQNVKF